MKDKLMTTDDRRTALKEKFILERGYWNSVWGDVLADDPDYFEAYLNFSSVPWKHGTLAPKLKEFIYIAIDTSATHMYKPGLCIHVQNAIRHGASREEIMEVLELSSEIGIHSCTTGIPILVEELQRAGIAEPKLTKNSPRHDELKKKFTERMGYWNDMWDNLLHLSPEFFQAYLDLATVPRKSTRLEPKAKELVLLALSAATTNLYEGGMRTHIRNALQLGASADELVEVLQLISVLGIHACTMGMPVMIEELDKKKDASAKKP